MSAYTEGYHCGFQGMSLDACHYAAQSSDRMDWMRGYYAGIDRREVARSRRFR